MRVLVLGSGGREHALTWALGRSPRVRTLRCAPGNAGIARETPCVPLDLGDIPGLVRHCIEARYDLVVVGPEAPLVAGLADRLREAGIAVFGPEAAAARIEGSKAFAKEFMTRHRIPTAAFRIFDQPADAKRYLRSDEASYPLVVKADGLAAGKGVVMAAERESALAAAEWMMRGTSLGSAGATIVVEETLRGAEASFFVLSDGESIVELPTCQDYKRVDDADRGPNTGGMGSYSPSAHLGPTTRKNLLETIVAATIRGLSAEGRPYRGVLYVGLMLTAEGPKVLEYNARFGDPEAQAILPRLDGDWLPLLWASAQGSLRDLPPLRWKDESVVCVVMTSEGYPATYAKGRPILGIEAAAALPHVLVFHSGTGGGPQGYVTAGGRVLGVTALGRDISTARDRAYDAVRLIHWEGEHHRTDIALDAVRDPATKGQA